MLLVFINCLVIAQERSQAILHFKDNNHDFGRILEENGPVGYKFSFSNKGTDPLQIVNVRTTCGCAIPMWTKSAVLPGDTGYIEVVFNPEGRKGDFHKTIQIQSNAQNANMFLTIGGTIMPAFHEEELKHKIGDLSIKADQVNLGYLYKGTTGAEMLTVANLTENSLEVDFGNIPKHIHIEVIPALLDPGDYGRIKVVYDTKENDEWDIAIDRVDVILNNNTVPDKKLTIIANIREDFRGLTEEEWQLAPVAQFNKLTYLTDTINDTQPLACKFELRNAGKTDLKIRAINASCGCTVAWPEQNILAPGEVTYIDAEFNPAGRSGKFKNGITVVTNDPRHYKKYLFIEGFIDSSE